VSTFEMLSLQNCASALMFSQRMERRCLTRIRMRPSPTPTSVSTHRIFESSRGEALRSRKR
jgi:hypothetical protein